MDERNNNVALCNVAHHNIGAICNMRIYTVFVCNDILFK